MCAMPNSKPDSARRGPWPIQPIVKNEYGTRYRPGLSIKADHLTRESRSLLLESFGSVSAHFPGRHGLISRDDREPFRVTASSSADRTRAGLPPFRFMLSNGFVGE